LSFKFPFAALRLFLMNFLRLCKIQLYLKPGFPTKGDDEFPSGLYGGSCFRMKYSPGDDYLCFEVYLPAEQMNNVLDSLDKNPTMQIEVGLYLLSFSYEVDSLREWDDPQRLFIEDHAATAAMMVKTSSTVAATSDMLNEQLEGTHLQGAKIDFSPIARQLGRLTVAMWVLVAVIDYVLLK
jgi:hypothetical protein